MATKRVSTLAAAQKSSGVHAERSGRGMRPTVAPCLLLLVALVVVGCAITLAALVPPDEQPGTLPPAPGQLA
jgi:hypothetical protein